MAVAEITLSFANCHLRQQLAFSNGQLADHSACQLTASESSEKKGVVPKELYHCQTPCQGTSKARLRHPEEKETVAKAVAESPQLVALYGNLQTDHHLSSLLFNFPYLVWVALRCFPSQPVPETDLPHDATLPACLPACNRSRQGDCKFGDGMAHQAFHLFRLLITMSCCALCSMTAQSCWLSCEQKVQPWQCLLASTQQLSMCKSQTQPGAE